MLAPFSIFQIAIFQQLTTKSSVDDTDVSAPPPVQQEEEPLKEPLKELQMVYPEPNAPYKSPLTFRFNLIAASDFSELMEFYAGRRWLCLQLDGSWRRCIPIESGTLIQETIDVGNHTARLVLVDSSTPETGKQLMKSEQVSFTVLSDEDFAAVLRQQRLDDLALHGPQTGEEDMSVVEWYRLKTQRHNDGNGGDSAHVTHEVDAATGDSQPVNTAHNSPTDPPLLVIGVKTRVIDGFRFRQAIRQTWASKDNLPNDVRVLFAGCRVPADASEEVRQAVAYEQKVFGGDLLTDVLDCEDSYATLPDKVKEFLHFVGVDHVLRRSGYVMIADDDVYVRARDFAEQLAALGPLHDLYAGHVKQGNSFVPERDPQRRYYLPESVYPLDEFPPFAWGPHYLMSMDVVEFIADNREELQGLGPLDDVTIALWLLAIQVHPQHLELFRNLRESPCSDDLLAYADLGPLAMRMIQSNLQSGRNFCHGFNAHTWDRDGLR
ncbi:hypothetical protein PF005_g3888 [Phytophthora fragariae]|uniref:Hexosyltransferase n=1 Tax=Phytophthora fragariae TaxID=53985 RepID=A0A6A4ETT4_9STRA|nr:hypothetical protein PF009_g4266 [Phytophthora fragariae]KAE9132122.1 hypothetical protein PF007_g3833 [Phytophthora fragariae]KAE9152478.1 hypothetical protein PF006_g3314 [Phytophthora fragariae]KAE9229382.1 hypothetical protein PF005_g3888 [Phytophthora fragariae]KAE9251154.1 hypothetical protein PF002_g4404 [Phytophthora fragariae]